MNSTTAILLAAAVCAAVPDVASAASCRPRRPKPPVVLTSMGPCAFDHGRLSFAGAPEAQARCLMRPVARRAKLGPVPEALPPALAERLGATAALPSRAVLARHLTEIGLDGPFARALLWPVSRARDGDPFAPAARYLVLHDTSGPNLRRFPDNLDSHRKINNLARFRCSDNWELAHVVINRPGDVFIGHDFEEPWRATKFERATAFGTDLKGLFIHVELIQPRRGRAGIVAPVPGFTRAQYDRLALVYVIASVRAGDWLIPATHAAIDNHIRNGHDDPQNFELAEFDLSLETLAARLNKLEEPVLSTALTEPDTAVEASRHDGDAPGRTASDGAASGREYE